MEGVTYFGPEHFPVQPDREEIFRWLGCGGDSPCRAAFEAAWDGAEACIRRCARPQAAAVRCGDGTLTVFLTLGPGPEENMTELFRREEYIAGSLLNTMSDGLLFRMDSLAVPLLGELLRREHAWAGSRLEPGVDLAVEAQREKLPPVQSVLPFVRMSETGVLFPAKSMMYVVQVSDRPCGQALLHDCARCSQVNCLYRHRPEADP